MVTVLFYEKPGCINNTRQKRLLQDAGHRVIARSLLLEPWTPDRLRPFFDNLPLASWFNTTAPAIKTGLVVPHLLDSETALALMVLDPLLIRRPLMQVGDQCWVGFDTNIIDQWIGLYTDVTPKAQLEQTDLQTCPRTLA
jgi:nitrogenase-associated protein